MKKKVLFLMPALPGGGAEKVLIDILKNFDYSRYDVSLFLEYKEGIYLSDVPRDVCMLSLHKNNNLWFQRLHRRLKERHLYGIFHELVYRPMFLWLMRGKQYNVIISFMEGAAVKFHSYITGKAEKNLSWVHIDFKKKHWSLDFFKNEEDEAECYQKMNEIVFVSDDARQRFLEMYPLNSSRCSVLYNLIDGKEIKRQAGLIQVDKRKFTVCMVGRLNWQKRYDRAIEVAHLLKGNGYDIDFWIFGVGELEDELKGKIKEYGLEDYVFLRGFVKSPYAYIACADLFLNTSESEGYPLTICEALCLGCPVVATDITGAGEILEKSQYGLLVDEDINAIYNGMKSMIDNEGLRKEYARKALERAKMFQVEETMNRIYSIIQ